MNKSLLAIRPFSLFAATAAGSRTSPAAPQHRRIPCTNKIYSKNCACRGQLKCLRATCHQTRGTYLHPGRISEIILRIINVRCYRLTYSPSRCRPASFTTTIDRVSVRERHREIVASSSQFWSWWWRYVEYRQKLLKLTASCRDSCCRCGYNIIIIINTYHSIITFRYVNLLLDRRRPASAMLVASSGVGRSLGDQSRDLRQFLVTCRRAADAQLVVGS